VEGALLQQQHDLLESAAHDIAGGCGVNNRDSSLSVLLAAV
jgi:hypothetical protein